MKLNKKPKLIILGIIIVALVGGGVFWWWLVDNKAKQSQNNQNEISNNQQAGERIIYEEQELISRKDAKPNNSYTINHKIYSLDLNGKEKLLYSFIDDQSGSAIYITKDNKIYITVKSKNSYILLDKDGRDITATDNLFLKDKDLSVDRFLPFKSGKKVIYGLDVDSETKEGDNHNLYIKDLDTGKVEEIKNADFPKGVETIEPVGWSKDENSFYAELVGWEGLEFSGLWRVNAVDKTVKSIKSVEKTAIWNLRVYPELDLALGVEGTTNEELGMGGDIVAPNTLFLIDLNNDTKKQIATTDKNLLTGFYLSSNQKEVLYQEREYKVEENTAKMTKITTKIINLDANEVKKIPIDKEIVYCSSDLKTVLVQMGGEGLSEKHEYNLTKTIDGIVVTKLKDNQTSYQDWKKGEKVYEFLGFLKY